MGGRRGRGAVHEPAEALGGCVDKRAAARGDQDLPGDPSPQQVRGWRCCSKQEPEARGLPARRSISHCNSSFQTLSIFILSHPSSRLSILGFEELPALVFLFNKTQLCHLRFGLAFLCPWPRVRCVGLPPSPGPDTGSLDGNSKTLCLFSNQSL